MILAGDIGGTNCRLLACDAQGRALLQQVYPSRNFAGLADVVQEFMRYSGQRFAIACLGLPGPVLGDTCRLTNLPWEVNASELSRQTQIERVLLLNDLAANAYGLETLKDEELLTLNAGQPAPQGNVVIVAPGTGLGEAGLTYAEGRPVAIATEGGHADFGPTNDLEIELLRYAQHRLQDQEVTYETFVSGPGLGHLYDFLRERSLQPAPAWLDAEFAAQDRAAVIGAAALANRDPVCVAALDLFVELLAAEAANMALKFLAVGGVYLGGGIPPKICQKLLTPRFMQRFTRKSKMSWLLPRIPVRVILNDRTALQGAAVHARRNLIGS